MMSMSNRQIIYCTLPNVVKHNVTDFHIHIPFISNTIVLHFVFQSLLATLSDAFLYDWTGVVRSELPTFQNSGNVPTG